MRWVFQLDWIPVPPLLTAQTINLPALFMGAALGILPVVVIFFFVQRYIVEGVKVSGIKA